MTMHTILHMIYWTCFGLVILASIWDIRRSHRAAQASLARIKASAERIARLTDEALGRTPAP